MQVLQKAVCPEKRIGIDSAVSALASVTEVEVSSDLAIAKVYLSVFSDDQGKSIAMSGLKRLEGYVRKHIATSMNLRMAPEIRFLQDDTIARAEHVSMLNKPRHASDDALVLQINCAPSCLMGAECSQQHGMQAVVHIHCKHACIQLCLM